MRNNFTGGASTTGGAGALTIQATDGLALPAAAFVSGQTVEYSIVEYTDPTRATVSKAESGHGTVSSTNVLTRWRPVETWVAGALNQSAPSAVSFGADNVRVYMTAIAEGGPTAFPARANFAAAFGFGPDGHLVGANFPNTSDFSSATLTADTLYMTPVRIENGFAITSLGVNVTTLAAGKRVSACIAAFDPINGIPGAVLLAANNLSVAASGFVTATVAGRLLAPGWYWMCIVSDGTPAIMGSDNVLPGPMGMQGMRSLRFATRSRAYGTFTVGDSAMTGSSGSPSGVVNAAAPILAWR